MFSEALNETLDSFKISNRELAVKSGLREATISQFRQGKRAIPSDSLEKIIKALSPKASNYLFFTVLTISVSDEEVYLFFMEVAQAMKKSEKILAKAKELVLN
jgi:transcriptional regulator with XRE-family HTH domain